jgi:hypothetical protein
MHYFEVYNPKNVFLSLIMHLRKICIIFLNNLNEMLHIAIPLKYLYKY